MAIEYKGDKRTFSCDTCGEELQDNHGKTIWHSKDDWDILLDDMREAGWDARKLKDGSYEHTCWDCMN